LVEIQPQLPATTHRPVEHAANNALSVGVQQNGATAKSKAEGCLSNVVTDPREGTELRLIVRNSAVVTEDDLAGHRHQVLGSPPQAEALQHTQSLFRMVNHRIWRWG
jgi:hypothetical protein